ncbi:MAG: ABC transporter permease [Symbiobacteriia bacterium]
MSAAVITELDSAQSEPSVSPALLFWRRFARNRAAVFGLFVIVGLILIALLAPYIVGSPIHGDYDALTQPPSVKHLFGTDGIGRDVLARTVYGSRISLEAGLISVSIALAIGLPIGLMSGYYRGFWDEMVVMRIVDAMQAFPFMILALTVAAVLGSSFANAMIAIGVGYAPSFIRVVRAAAMQVREQEFVQSARAAGASDLRILVRYILPNSMAPILIQTTLAVASAIIAEAGLSYLGVGVQPPTPSWGADLHVAQGFLQLAPWMTYFSGGAIFVAVLGFNLFGDGLRDALDPKLRGR